MMTKLCYQQSNNMAMVRISLSMLFRVSKSFGLVLRKSEYVYIMNWNDSTLFYCFFKVSSRITWKILWKVQTIWNPLSYISMYVHCKFFIQNVPCIKLDLLFCLFASAMLPQPLPCNVTHVTKHSPLHFNIINLLLQCPYCNLVRIDKSD